LKKAHELAPAAADPGVLVNLGNLLKYAAHASPLIGTAVAKFGTRRQGRERSGRRNGMLHDARGVAAATTHPVHPCFNHVRPDRRARRKPTARTHCAHHAMPRHARRWHCFARMRAERPHALRVGAWMPSSSAEKGCVQPASPVPVRAGGLCSRPLGLCCATDAVSHCVGATAWSRASAGSSLSFESGRRFT
jgi:hypothetical protein